MEETEINFLGDKLWLPGKDTSFGHNVYRFYWICMERVCHKDITMYKEEYDKIANQLGGDVASALEMASALSYNYFECDRNRRGVV